MEGINYAMLGFNTRKPIISYCERELSRNLPLAALLAASYYNGFQEGSI